MGEGWPAHRMSGGPQRLGLVLLSSWRAIFIDMTGGFSAMPLTKIDRLEIVSPRQVILSTWYARLHRGFESHRHCAAVLNRLRQDPIWNAVEVGSTGKHGHGPECVEQVSRSRTTAPRQEVVASRGPPADCAPPFEPVNPASIEA